MHDPKLSATVAQHLPQLSESLVDKYSSSHQHLRFPGHLASDHFDSQFHHRPSKAMPLPRTIFPATPVSYPEDILDISRQRQLLPLFQRMKDMGLSPELLPFAGSVSAISDLAAQYRYSDFLRARRLYEPYHGDHGAVSLPLSITTFSPRGASERDFVFPARGPCPSSSAGVVIKDLSPVPTTLAMLSPTTSSLSPSLSARAVDALSLSPLHVSTTVSSSSPVSLQSSPSPHRHSSVSPDSRRTDPNLSHQVTTRPALLSSVSAPGDLSFEERAWQRERTRLEAPLPAPLTLPPPLWHPQTSTALYAPVPPPLMRMYAPLSSSFDYPANVSHLLDQYISSSTGSSLSQHHLHHHLHHYVRDSLFNRSSSNTYLDSRSSPGKELPTKSLKQDRIRDRQELSGALDADREHSERLCNVKKSASTQTQFSSFSCENLPPPPYYTTHDTIPHDKLHAGSAPGHPCLHHLPPPAPPPPALVQYSHTTSSGHPPLHAASIPPPLTITSHHPPQTAANRLSSIPHTSPSPPSAATPSLPPPPTLTQIPRSSHQSLPPYPSSPRSCSPPPPPHYTERTRVHNDVQHAPLNLSLSSALPVLSSTPPPRPSVITNVSYMPPIRDSDSYRRDAHHKESASHRLVAYKNGSSHETAAQVSDEAIEEHFRRSLGKRYNEPSSPKKQAVHVSEKMCSVDDHFARALGDQMWTEIKARSEVQPQNPLSETVDAHFAKALGPAMWKKLKAEGKLVDDAATISTQPQQQHNKQHTNLQQQPQFHQQPIQQKAASTSPLQTSLVT